MSRAEDITVDGRQMSAAKAGATSDAPHAFVQSKSALIGAILLAAVLAMALFGALVFDGDPFEIVGPPHMQPGQSAAFPLGTDHLGRSVWAALIAGAGNTLFVGFLAALIAVSIGTIVGAMAGLRGGVIDDLLMRVAEFFQVLPPLLVAMILVALFSSSAIMIAFAIGIVTWPQIARLTRAEFLRIREHDYVTAARLIGIKNGRMMYQVILPNALPPLIVSATLTVGYAFLFETGLSFLGLGDPNTMSWGQMIGSSSIYIFEAWWPIAFPTMAVFVTVLSVTLIGDGINDALDPKHHTGLRRSPHTG